MLQEVCGVCSEYNTLRTTLSYTERGNKAVRKRNHYELAASLNERADFTFPVRGPNSSTTHIGRHVFIPLLEVPGVAMLTVKDAHDVYSKVVAQSLFSCWPLIVFTISLAILSGIVVWFLVSMHKFLSLRVWPLYVIIQRISVYYTYLLPTFDSLLSALTFRMGTFNSFNVFFAFE